MNLECALPHAITVTLIMRGGGVKTLTDLELYFVFIKFK